LPIPVFSKTIVHAICSDTVRTLRHYVPVLFCHNLAVKEFPLLWTKQQFQDICSWRERERERLKKRDILSANPDARALSLAKALDKRYAQMLAMGTETSCLRDTETPQLPSAIHSPKEKFATLTSETRCLSCRLNTKLGMPSLP
jgi:hypothetical protein